MQIERKGAGIIKARTALLILLLAAAPALAETHVSIGVHLGGGYGYYPAPPPPPVYVYQPPCPGPGYYWVPGYYYRVGPRYSWHVGYWSAPHSHHFYGGPAYRVYGDRGGHYGGKGKGKHRR